VPVRSILIRPGVSNRKIGELQVGVAANLIHIEKIEQVEFSKGKFKATSRDRSLQDKWICFFVDPIGGERNHVEIKSAGKIE
jgi:hypothetical protein